VRIARQQIQRAYAIEGIGRALRLIVQSYEIASGKNNAREQKSNNQRSAADRPPSTPRFGKRNHNDTTGSDTTGLAYRNRTSRFRVASQRRAEHNNYLSYVISFLCDRNNLNCGSRAPSPRFASPPTTTGDESARSRRKNSRRCFVREALCSVSDMPLRNFLKTKNAFFGASK